MKTVSLSPALICLTLLIYMGSLSAQDSSFSLSSAPPKPDNFWRRVAIGGNLGFQVGNVTGITVSPEIRIRTVDQLYVGFRFIYQYYSYKNYFYDADNQEYLSFNSNVFGGSIYLRYYLSSIFDNFLANLFAHAEYEYMAYLRPYAESNLPDAHIYDPYGFTYIKANQTVEYNSIFLGGGYRQPIGNRVSMDLLILFNINDTYNSPYSNPIFRLGVGVGL